MPSSSLLVGSPAPDFSLRSHTGMDVTLKSQLGNGPLFLIFYPGDFTPVCTKQLCSYRDHDEDFKKFGLKMIGISSNNPESHAKFAAQYRFNFPLLSDPKREVAKTYGCTSLLMMGGVSRAVFILNSQGIIVYRYVEPTVITHRKPGELLSVLEGLKFKEMI